MSWVVVSGAGRGIGAATANHFAAEGRHVLALDVDVDDVDVDVHHPNVRLVACDVTDGIAIREAVIDFVAADGVDVLVNNVGFGMLSSLLDATPELWQTAWTQNVMSSVEMTTAVLPLMLSAGRGAICNVGSIWATRGGPRRAPYITTKHALVGFTRALAAEFGARNIHVCGVNPGPVVTRQTLAISKEEDRVGWLQPQEVAAIIAFAVSPAGRGLHGSFLEATGAGRPVGT